jgi:murein L,D-transpeptidase YcbB/YkuD
LTACTRPRGPAAAQARPGAAARRPHGAAGNVSPAAAGVDGAQAAKRLVPPPSGTFSMPRIPPRFPPARRGAPKIAALLVLAAASALPPGASCAVTSRVTSGTTSTAAPAAPGAAAAARDAGPFGAAWFVASRPTPLAEAAVELLADAASHGLDPRDYAAAELRRLLAAARDAPVADEPRIAALAQRLTRSLLRYLDHLHRGRLPVHRGAAPDAAATLRAAVAAQDLTLAVQAASPALPQYRKLREALAHYRALADDAAWKQPLPPLPRPAGARAPVLNPGDAWAGLPALAERLVRLGDLDPRLAPPAIGARYDEPWVAAVQALQQRHGLQADGVIGRATRAVLQVPPRQRARQLELALERLRQLQPLQAPRQVVVNIPEFVLRAYEAGADGRVDVQVESKVIVGQALDWRTPLIREEMRHIEFRPFWNVPASIAREELVPLLQRQPALWARDGYEFVGGPSDRPDAELSPAKLDAVLAGALRIRQRPGPRNALGDIKFVFPNREAIYLHHTPSVRLFEQARRDFSHGCIRVEQPVPLARFALAGTPGWDDAAIRAAMASGEPPRVTLAQPVPVLIAYVTALVKEGRVHFFDDLYGHDRALDAALRRATFSAASR